MSLEELCLRVSCQELALGLHRGRTRGLLSAPLLSYRFCICWLELLWWPSLRSGLWEGWVWADHSLWICLGLPVGCCSWCMACPGP